jgi:hypothetical protein
VESPGNLRDTLLWGWRNSIVSLEFSYTSPARPSDKSRVKVKTLEWLQALAWSRDRRILIFWINVNCIISKNNFSGFAMELTFYKFKSRGLHEKTQIIASACYVATSVRTAEGTVGSTHAYTTCITSNSDNGNGHRLRNLLHSDTADPQRRSPYFYDRQTHYLWTINKPL